MERVHEDKLKAQLAAETASQTTLLQKRGTFGKTTSESSEEKDFSEEESSEEEDSSKHSPK